MGEKILLNILWEAQEKYGYLSEDVLKKISSKHQIPISRLYGIATFHSFLRTKKQGKHILEVCGSPTCVLNESRDIENFLKRKLKIDIGETTKDKKFSLYKTSCIGCCDEAPAMLVDGMPYTKLTKKRVAEILEELSPTMSEKKISSKSRFVSSARRDSQKKHTKGGAQQNKNLNGGSKYNAGVKGN